MSNKFGILWYTNFVGMMYAGDDKGLIIGPYFTDEKEAQKIYEEHISTWNPKFVSMTFIEDSEEYEFICYQDPKVSFSKVNFGFYRSSMNRKGNYEQAREEIIKSGCRLGLFYGKYPDVNMIGKETNVNSMQIIPVSQVVPNSYESYARKACAGK